MAKLSITYAVLHGVFSSEELLTRLRLQLLYAVLHGVFLFEELFTCLPETL
jgi:hypothetical protein